MITITRQFTRPSIDIPWHHDALPFEEFKLKRQVYMHLRKLVSHTITYSEDGLQMFYEGVWASQEDHDEFTAETDLAPIRDLRNAYNKSVGIKVGPKIGTLI